MERKSLGHTSGENTSFPNSLQTRARGFTLAEVLITLGIIGVIAAMTIPALYGHMEKIIVENKLKVFNAKINEAFALAQEGNGGGINDWIVQDKSYSFAEMKSWVTTYLLPYIKGGEIINAETDRVYMGSTLLHEEAVTVRMGNGMVFSIHIDANGGDMAFFANGNLSDRSPRNRFQFQFAKKVKQGGKEKISDDKVEPYIFNWDGNREHLKTTNFWACKKGCNTNHSNCGYCTKLIQLNGWKIPSDYPW